MKTIILHGIIFLKDKVLFKSPNNLSTIQYKYKDIQTQYNIDDFNKQDFINYIENNNFNRVYIAIYLVLLVYLFGIYGLVTILDVLILALVGSIFMGLSRVRLKFKPIFQMSIYSLTLPIILNIIYIVLNLVFAFNIKYFQFMYNAIAYIYLITAILMIKSDIIKQQAELMKLVEEQKKVKEEVEEENNTEDDKNKNEEKNDKEEKKKENGPEPEGSNA